MHLRYFYQTRETAPLLPSGVVLVAGNAFDANEIPCAGAEFYNSRTSKWTVTGSLHKARVWEPATFLPNGKVLVAGGALPPVTCGHVASLLATQHAAGTAPQWCMRTYAAFPGESRRWPCPHLPEEGSTGFTHGMGRIG